MGIKDMLQKVLAFQEADEAAMDAAEDGDDEEAEKALTEDSEEEKAAKDSAVLLYQTCQVNSGFSLPTEGVADFSSRLERLVRVGLGVGLDTPVSEVEIPEDPEPEPEVEDDEAEDDVDMDAEPEAAD